MKHFLNMLAAAGIGAAATGIIVWTLLSQKQDVTQRDLKTEHATSARQQTQTQSEQHAADLKRLALAITTATAKELEADRLRAQLAAAENNASLLRPDPAGLLERLQKLDPAGADRIREQRQVIHLFASLTQLGAQSLPDIEAFLQKDMDIDYQKVGDSQPDMRRFLNVDDKVDLSSLRDYSAYNLPEFKTVLPHSLRLGLFETLRDIGGDAAEAILLAELDRTGRGIEVVHLAQMLEDLRPGVHKERLLNAARELAKEPLDDTSRRLLFAFLQKHKDPTLIDFAKRILISKEGRVDGSALRFINETLGEKAMPILYQAYRNPTITNPGDKIILRDATMKYVGMNAQSDEIFREVMDEGLKTSAESKEFGLGRYGAMWQPMMSLSAGDNLPPEAVRNRQGLLKEVRGRTTDQFLHRGMDMVHQRLEVMLDPTKTPPSPFGIRPPRTVPPAPPLP